MKKLILILVALVFVQIVVAQNFEMRLVEYNPITYRARIQFYNKGSVDLHNLKLIVDSSAPIDVASFLKANGLMSAFFGIKPGKHNLTLMNDEEVTVKREMYFPHTETQLQEEIEKRRKFEELEEKRKEALRRLAEENRLRAEQEIQEQLANAPIVEKKRPYWLLGVIIVGIIVLFYWLIKRYK